MRRGDLTDEQWERLEPLCTNGIIAPSRKQEYNQIKFFLSPDIDPSGGMPYRVLVYPSVMTDATTTDAADDLPVVNVSNKIDGSFYMSGNW